MRAHKGRRKGRRDGPPHKGREDSAHTPLALHSLPNPLYPYTVNGTFLTKLCVEPRRAPGRLLGRPRHGKTWLGTRLARSPLTYRSRDSPLHHWNGCINEVMVGVSERTEARFWNPRCCARRPPGWRCNSRRSGVKGCREVGLQSNKEGREGSKVFRSEALPRGIQKGPGREGSRESRDARPRRQQPGHEAGLGSLRSEQCALGFRKLTPCGSHPLPVTAPSREPAPFSSPALRPMGSFLLPPSIIYKPVYPQHPRAFLLGRHLPRLLARPGDSLVCREV